MKKQLLIGLLTLGMGFSAQAINLDIVNTVDFANQANSAHLTFHGDDTFTFDEALGGFGAGYDFVVNGTTDGAPAGPNSAFGLRGNITGTFTIGTVVSNTAPVSSSAGATLSIFDGTNTFSGLIDWIEISQSGTGDNLNIDGFVNLTGITYTGTVLDLIALKGSNDTASATIAFSFGTAVTISALKDSPFQTSYSGDLTSVPEGGTTVGLLGLGLTALGLSGRFRRKHS